MDFLDRILDYIESSVPLYDSFSVGTLKDGNSVAVRPTPTSISTRYVEGSKIYPYGFQVLTKHKNMLTAYKAIQDVTEAIDGLTNGAITSSDGSFVFDKCEATTLPNWVEKDTQGYTIYTAIFQAELYKEV